LNAFLRALSITVGVGLGLGLLAGLFFGGRELVSFATRQLENRRAAEQAQVAATARAVYEPTAQAQRAQATAARQTAITEQRVAIVQATQAAVETRSAIVQATQAARYCAVGQKVAVSSVLQTRPYLGATEYFASGTVRNTCTYPVRVELEHRGLAANGSVLETRTTYFERLAPGEERAFNQWLATRRADIASLSSLSRVMDLP
jgi:hypothetical protein